MNTALNLSMTATIFCFAAFCLQTARRFCSFHVLIVLLVTMTCGPTVRQCMAADDPVSVSDIGRASARWPTCNAEAESQTLSFIHVADAHARYNPDRNGSSPMARLRGFVEQVRGENPFTLFTNAGDDYEKGSIAEEISRGLTTRQVVQAMQYDVRTLGNHDFAWGIEELLAFSNDPGGVVVASNTKMTDSKTNSSGDETPGWTDYAELTVGCVRIGFFGLVSKPWNEKDEQYEGPFFQERPDLRSNFNFVAIANEIIARHRQEVDLLVLVSHLGLYEDIHLAEQTQGIDLILGGHTHTTLTEPVRIKNTSIVHTGAFVEKIGRFDLDFDLRDRRPGASRFVLTDNRGEESPVDEATERKVQQIISPYLEAIHAVFANVSAGQDKKSMALIAARAAVEVLGADAAFVSRHSAWKEWQTGVLTQQDVLDAFPVEREPAGKPGISSLYLITGTGADLLHATAALADFAYWGPENIDPTATYTIAIQKPQALRQREYFGREISLAPPDHAAELWEAVVAFAQGKQTDRLSVDEKTFETGSFDLLAFLSAVDRQSSPERGKN